MGTITLAGSRGYQDIGTIGQTVPQLAENVLSINAILDVGLRNTRDYQHGWIRVSDLIGLGLATLINGDQLTATVSSGSSSVNVTNSITGTGSGATPLQLSGDVGSPGNDYFYGTNGSGIKGFYALSSYSGTVTSVGLSNSDTYIAIGGTNPVTTTGTITVNLSSGAATDLGLAATALQPGGIQNMESAGWNSSNGAVQLSLTVPQDILIPYAATLREVYILTQGGAGSCTVTLSKCAIGSFPGSLTDITGGVPPAIASSSAPYTNTTLSGWTTSFSQNDIVRCTLTANTNFTSVKIILRMY